MTTEKADLTTAKKITAELEHGPTRHVESDPRLLNEFDPAVVKKIKRKIDYRLLPVVTLMYAISLMDRTNLGNLSIAGMTKDLHIVTGYGYNLCNMCFFITYITFAPAMVAFCRWIGPRWFLPLVCFIWGCVLIGAGWIKNWHSLLGVRLILGVLEAGFFPSCLYLLSTWYTRFESAKRFSLFFLIGSFLGALSNILAYGLQQMEGLANIRGWRWIIIMEGLITVVIAFVGFMTIVKFPDEELKKPSPMFLKTEELQIVAARIDADRADVELEPFTWKRFLEPVKNFYIFGFPFLLMLVTTIVNSFSFTLPIILRETLGFNIAQSQCLTAPPYAMALIIGYGCAWVSDKYQVRGPILIGLALVSITGLGILGWSTHPWVRYFGVFVTLAGSNSSIAAITAYQSTNIRGQWRRALCSALLTGLGGFGGIIGALIFRAQDRPHYIPGFIACLVASGLVIVTVIVMTLYFRRCNAQADRGERILLGDPNFRFTI